MDTEKKDFDKAASSWDEKPERVKLARDIARAIKGQGVVEPDMDVLDFGCGTGLLTLELQPLVRSITGADSSQGMLDVLHRKIASLSPGNVTTRLVDLEKGDSLTGSYHLVVSSMAFHHVKDIPQLLGRFYAVLMPSGHVCVADLDLEGGRFHEDNTGVFHFGFDRAELRGAFADAGFDDVRESTATTMAKEAPDGTTREFAIFLMSGRKK